MSRRDHDEGEMTWQAYIYLRSTDAAMAVELAGEDNGKAKRSKTKGGCSGLSERMKHAVQDG
jgi:hypothetical protein